MRNFKPALPVEVGGRYDIEHLDWTPASAVLAYGRRIGVRVNEPDLLGAIERKLPYDSKPTQAKKLDRLYSLVTSVREKNVKLRRAYTLFAGDKCLARSLQVGAVLDVLERDARLFVAEHARRRVFVHAGVVGWNGRAIVIPGESMSGKTSLTAEFVRAGATYYSDEFAVFDEQGRVHPYAKPLSIRGRDGYTQTDYPVQSLGGRAGTRPLSVGMVLVTAYRNGSRWRPRRISAGMGAFALLANTVAVRKQPERSLDTLRNVVNTASVLKSVRGEAGVVVDFVLGCGDLGRQLQCRANSDELGAMNEY